MTLNILKEMVLDTWERLEIERCISCGSFYATDYELLDICVFCSEFLFRYAGYCSDRISLAKPLQDAAKLYRDPD